MYSSVSLTSDGSDKSKEPNGSVGSDGSDGSDGSNELDVSVNFDLKSLIHWTSASGVSSAPSMRMDDTDKFSITGRKFSLS